MRAIGTILLFVLVALILMMWPSLDCVPPFASWRSPDGGAVLTVCRHTTSLTASATPQGLDTPGFAVLHTAARIADVVTLPAVNGVIDHPPEWSEHGVVLPHYARLTIPAKRPSLGSDLMWRLRAALGRIPQGAEN